MCFCPCSTMVFPLFDSCPLSERRSWRPLEMQPVWVCWCGNKAFSSEGLRKERRKLFIWRSSSDCIVVQIVDVSPSMDWWTVSRPSLISVTPPSMREVAAKVFSVVSEWTDKLVCILFKDLRTWSACSPWLSRIYLWKSELTWSFSLHNLKVQEKTWGLEE